MQPDLLTRLYHDHLTDLERRYAAVLESAGVDAVLIHSGTPLRKSRYDDQFWPLRPVPHFQHWVPLAEPDCAVLIRPGHPRRLYWPQPQSFWEQPPAPESDHFLSGWEVVRPERPEVVRDLLPTGLRLAFLGEDLQRRADWGLAEQPFDADLAGRLDRLRSVKTPYEVACLAEANRRAAQGHDAVVKAFRAGERSELALHLTYLYATHQDDPETPYKNIVALGRHAATLHHVAYSRHGQKREAESLLVDAGATCLGYASDITRTWHAGHGAAHDAFAQLVHGLERMQQHLCEEVQVGLPYEELHEEAHRRIAGVLREVGLLRQNLSQEVQGRVTRAFFPHGLGHSLGLQTHDVGCALVKPKLDNPYLRNTSIIEPGQVFTIEPGVYFIDALLEPLRQGPDSAAVDWKLVDALRDLGGVRIEDDLHVTGGREIHRNLTREHLPVGGGT